MRTRLTFVVITVLTCVSLCVAFAGPYGGRAIDHHGNTPLPFKASTADFFLYSTLTTGVGGSYGVDGFVGADGIDRIVFYASNTGYIFTVTIPLGANPHMHPDNPQATGPIAPRTYTFERSFGLGVFPGHECEFWVDEVNNVLYLGAAVGIRRYDWVPALSNYAFTAQIAPAAPMGEGYGTQSLGYDAANDIWYAGSISWNNTPGVTLRDMWKYDGAQGPGGSWTLAFQYTTPDPSTSGTHHDGMEFLNGFLWLADYTGNDISQYAPDGTLQAVFSRQPLAHELEGMGFGALNHYWCGSHGETITEFGGGRLQEPLETEVVLDIKPNSCPNPLNVKFKGGGGNVLSARAAPTEAGGVLPVAILGTEDFDVTQIDVMTLTLEGVAPIRWHLEDVATPVVEDSLMDCECTTDGPDGYLDLTLKFDKEAIIQAIPPVTNGEEIPLTIAGALLDGTALTGSDCVLIRASKTSIGFNPNEVIVAAAPRVRNYPNPFNATTTITYTLTEPANVNLTVYNVLGQPVAVLVDANQAPGEYSVTWSGDNLASGMYLYRFQAGAEAETRKMTLLK